MRLIIFIECIIQEDEGLIRKSANLNKILFFFQIDSAEKFRTTNLKSEEGCFEARVKRR